MVSLFVGNLPSNCTESSLYDLFSPFGIVKNVNIVRKINGDKEPDISLGYGFIEMSDIRSAHMAIQSLHGQLWNGRNVKVAWASPKSSPRKHSSIQDGAINSVHVQFHSKKAHVEINENVIREVFKIFGLVVDVCIKRLEMTKGGVRRGYCFVHFPSTLEGRRACETAVSQFGTHVLVQMVVYKCSISKHFMETKDSLITPTGTSECVDSISYFPQSERPSIDDSCTAPPIRYDATVQWCPTLPAPLCTREEPIASSIHGLGIVTVPVPVPIVTIPTAGLGPPSVILSGGTYFAPIQQYYSGDDMTTWSLCTIPHSHL